MKSNNILYKRYFILFSRFLAIDFKLTFLHPFNQAEILDTEVFPLTMYSIYLVRFRSTGVSFFQIKGISEHSLDGCPVHPFHPHPPYWGPVLQYIRDSIKKIIFYGLFF